MVKEELTYKEKREFEGVFFDALNQKVLNNNQEALDLFKKAIELYPKSHASMFQAAGLSYTLGFYNDAMEYATAAVRNNPTYNHWYYGQVGQFYNKFGKYQDAAAVFNEMINQEPDNRSVYLEASNQYINAKQPKEAIRVLQKMKQVFGVERESSLRLETIYRKNGDAEAALREVKELSTTFKDNLEYKGVLAETYANMGRIKDAELELLDILRIDPQEGMAHFALYDIYNRSDKHEQAIIHLKKAFESSSVPIETKMQALSGYFLKLNTNKKLKEEVLELSDILVANHPDNAAPYLVKADIYTTLNEYEKARNYTKKYLEIKPADYKVWKKRINLNEKLKDYAQQILDINKALELFPNNAELYTHLGNAQLNNNLYDAAIETANQGLDIAIRGYDKAGLYAILGQVYARLKNEVKALSSFEQGLKANNSRGSLLNSYALYLAQQKIELTKSKELITKALSKDSRNPEYLYTRAYLSFASKENQEAIDWVSKAIANNKREVKFYVLLRDIYDAMGDLDNKNKTQRTINRLNNES